MKYGLGGAAFALPAILAFSSFACGPTTKISADDGGATADAGISETGTTEAAATGTTFADVYTMIMANSCTSAVCHYSGATTNPLVGGLDMSSEATAYAQLVGVPAAAGGTCEMMGFIRVVPGSPSTSLMYLKVSEASPPCGAHMPLTGMALTAQQLALIQTWIMEGANP